MKVVCLDARRGTTRRFYVGDEIYVVPKTDAHEDFVRRYYELTGASHAAVESYPALEPAKILLMTDEPDEAPGRADTRWTLAALDAHRGSSAFSLSACPRRASKK